MRRQFDTIERKKNFYQNAIKHDNDDDRMLNWWWTADEAAAMKWKNNLILSHNWICNLNENRESFKNEKFRKIKLEGMTDAEAIYSSNKMRK